LRILIIAAVFNDIETQKYIVDNYEIDIKNIIDNILLIKERYTGVSDFKLSMFDKYVLDKLIKV
jgi:hypothetical protein